ncbi:cell wall hydrolase/autolysin [Deinococcus proteolyticus MRP]|uniref:Cell wall hydrolase/autolysin n=1 Tax=Deinococcus proteolyticus (strain ATCC 35074 / DSM 20540 / JCM 6276 / NBRC 101906 / NCIMB 13154 / VKM Ac-1939 / CCM 2703 / MRP) TaxID=693977 RepID=F0RJM2_DEIPM|nr:N-acetylmuramoyl-L-alanine amidase [Deinococcus proteolyticus]ADY26592.1 cell wall hydrolase/autolysin [Deinococcus proteolyticus MRP]
MGRLGRRGLRRRGALLAALGLALASPAVATAPLAVPPVAPSRPAVQLELELRQAAGQSRVFVTLPAGTPPFPPQLTVQGREAWLELPFEFVPLRGELGPELPAYTAQGRRLNLTLGPGVSDIRAQFWPAVGGWPPGLLLELLPERTSATAPQPAAVVPVALPAPTPTPVPKPAATPTPGRPAGPVQARIVLDPGHGGIDPGMTSRWLREADVNLDVALRAARALEAHGVAVTLTRRSDNHLHTDKGTDLNLRSRMATAGQVSAFVSIHVNASTSSAAQGIETYYFGQPLPGQGRSLAVRENGGGSVGEALTFQAARSAQGVLGDLLSQAKLSFSRRLAGLVQAELVAATGAQNRGVKTDAFYVIRSPTTPAILTELGFGSSPAEGPRLASAEYRQRQAEAIARAVLRFLNAR